MGQTNHAGAEWYSLTNLDEIPSPSLLVYEERVVENIRRAIAMVGDVGRLRPHVKTHKMPGVIGLCLDAGITKFKCATIAEAEMAAQSGAPDMMLACQQVGPNQKRLRRLVQTYPGTTFTTIVDNVETVQGLSAEFAGAGEEIRVLLDLDTGMHRTGMPPGGPWCKDLYLEMRKLPGIEPGGLHVYDGHNRESDLMERRAKAMEEFKPALALVAELRKGLLDVPRIVAGGSPTFPVYAKENIPTLECSPGTFVFWDAGYGTHFKDLDFEPAALVLTRVISKPEDGKGGHYLCLDLGHKAVAAENPIANRVRLEGLPDAEFVSQSEEHLVVSTSLANKVAVGDVFFGVPWHICPTVALYGDAYIVRNGRAEGKWVVAARERCLTV